MLGPDAESRFRGRDPGAVKLNATEATWRVSQLLRDRNPGGAGPLTSPLELRRSALDYCN